MNSCRATYSIALRRSIPSLLLLLTLVLSATAQEDVLRPRIPSSLFKPITIGVEGGVNFNLFSQTLEQNPVIPGSVLNIFKSGSGFSPFAALMIDLPLTPSLALQLKGTYDAKTFGNTISALYDCPNDIGTVDIANVDAEYTVNVSYVGIGAALRINATPEIFATIGPIAHFRINDAELATTATIVSPEDCQWLSDSRVPNGKVNKETIKDTVYSSTRFGLEVGVGYKVPIAPSIWVVPQLRFQYMLSKPFDDLTTPKAEATRQNTIGPSTYITKDAMLHSLQLGVALWFQI
jgi:hypothetical protein